MPSEISSLIPTMNGGSFDHDEKNPPAFTILQKDGLDSSLPLLHVNGNESDDSPITCFENAKNVLYDRRHISRSNDHLVLASLQSNQTNPLRRKSRSKSQDSLQSLDKVPTIKSSMTLSTEDFNEVLNAKLRKIQERENSEQRRNGKRNHALPQRKPFITTVKSGEFLMPPPEVAALLGIPANSSENEEVDGCPPRTKFKPLISLNKRPEVRHSSHNARCSAALKATVDFTLGMMNATTIAASTLEEQKRIGRKIDNYAAGFPQTVVILPNRLEPIGGTMNALPNLRGDTAAPFGNIMFDRRVVRGSTCAITPALIDGEQSIAARQAEARRRQLARRRCQALASKALVARIGSPPPVSGRKHEPVQTELFLEELFEKPDEATVATQTDYFLDRPATPKYCPGKVGHDMCTQIEPGDLFDFDREVQPILETLVGKTIEQALIEVLEEEEIAALREQQRKFLELRAAEKAEARRLEEQERRIREEKDQRLRQHEESMEIQKLNEKRIAASTILSGYIAELLPAVLEGLKMSGFLLDDIKAVNQKDVEEGFMPWLMKEVKKEMGSMIESRELLMEIIKEILENRAETYRRLGEEYDASREKRPSREEGEEEGDHDLNFLNYEPCGIQSPDAI